jgi:hypothetical protein
MHIKLKNEAKMNIEDEHIWIIIKNLADKYKRDLNNIDDEYKQQLIKGYKICNGKTYNFKSIEEEEQYFMRSDVTPEEEVYYYELIVEWSEKTMTLSEIGLT